MEQRNRALRAVYDGLLNVSRDEVGHELFCYSRECFLSRTNWNELTKSHRGALYKNGRPVNKPFRKIFNIDEVEETERDKILKRMESEPYSVMHKANGHLFIVSSYLDEDFEQQLVMHTKGSLMNPENDLLYDDIQVFSGLYSKGLVNFLKAFPNATLMFEAVVAHDKHSMYDHDKERYGENAFVLLGVNVFEHNEWHELEPEGVKNVSKVLGCPHVDFFSTSEDLSKTFDAWYDHKNTEGYVIWFLNDGFRVKIKTKEYWANRFKKDLSVERILSMFKAKGDSKFQLKLPEEVSDDIIEIIDEAYRTWWSLHWIEAHKISDFFEYDKELSDEERKELFTRTDITIQQKQFLLAISENKNPIDEIWKSKKIRNAFYDFVMNDNEYYHMLETQLMEIVDSI